MPDTDLNSVTREYILKNCEGLWVRVTRNERLQKIMEQYANKKTFKIGLISRSKFAVCR